MSSSKIFNTKPILNNINKSNCLEQKWELITEKNSDNIEAFIKYKIDSKVARNEETESVGKTNSRGKPHFTNKISKKTEIFTKVEMIIMKKIN